MEFFQKYNSRINQIYQDKNNFILHIRDPRPLSSRTRVLTRSPGTLVLPLRQKHSDMQYITRSQHFYSIQLERKKQHFGYPEKTFQTMTNNENN